MSKRASALVQEWRELYKDELMKDWKLAKQKKALFPIKPLDIQKFKSFKIDFVLGTIVWENGADLAPEFLYENIKIAA
jgi:hypothetical protein